MRIVLGVLILIGLFIGASWLRHRFTTDARSASERAWGSGELKLAPIEEGWGRALVGVQSGVAPAALEEVRAAQQAPNAPTPPAPQPQRQPKPVQATHVVQAGENLGRICAQVYGTSDKRLVEAVAKANGLTSPNAIRAGQTLVLPDRAQLP
jgi:hypothetical protein